MNKWGWIFCSICLLIAIVVVLWNRYKTRKTMNTLDKMLTAAMDGTFSESTFNESLLSALETRLANYLSASVVSAQNLEKEKDRIKSLIADISHQTKTPIANLLLYTELLKEENLSSEARMQVEMIYTQSEKLRFLIDSLVKLSRLENGIISLNPVKSPIAPMLEQIKRQFTSKAQNKGLSLQFHPTNATACFDIKWTSEALGNLVDNAIKYTEQGSIDISVISYEMFVRIDVADTGIGISEEEQAKIFSRFYRSDKNAEEEGVGIGLHLAREILRSEGGYIKVTSQEGKGSVFSMFLPL